MATEVSILVTLKDMASKAIGDIDKGLGGMKDSLKGLGDTGLKVAGGIAGVGAIMKEAFDVGAQGAAVIQTEQSFNRLNEQLGITPGLLDRLREASRGTVDDMTLMSSTMTLAAGGEKVLASALIEATPRLMEIAKAANTLNPTLGDTAYMFDSVALGIKRGSPMILDNLGITIKVEEAYTKFAESLGKTSKELTSEEQKMAILNATLAAGDTLINQVGGSTASATDDFARLDTATKNLADKMKAALVPVLADAASALEIIITQQDRLREATDKHSEEMGGSAQTFGAYTDEMQRALEAQGYFTKVTDDGIQVFSRVGPAVRNVTDEFDLLTAAEFAAQKSIAEMAPTYEGVAGANSQLNTQLVETTAAIEEQTAAEEEAVEKVVDVGKALKQAGVTSLQEFGTQAVNARLQVIALNDAIVMLTTSMAALPAQISAAGGAIGSAQGTAPAPMSFVLNYSPTLSTADAYEVQQVLAPVVDNIVKGR